MAQGQAAKVFYVSGIVQGVGFRFFAQRAARRLGLAGYVRNLGDGRVEVYAIGSRDQLLAMRRELECGPRGASVAGVFDEDRAVEDQYAYAFLIEHDNG